MFWGSFNVRVVLYAFVFNKKKGTVIIKTLNTATNLE